MSHCDLILNALRDGSWKTTSTLYREVGPMILHSRISDLRKKGHTVEGRHVPGQTGAEGYEYRLASSVTFISVPRVRRPVDPLPLIPDVEQLALAVAPQHYDI
jgi:hypothetical protein